MQRSFTTTLAILLIASLVATQNITFEPPPPLTPTGMYTISNSSQDGRLIWSPKLEVLNLDNVTLPNGSIGTNVTLRVLNRSAVGPMPVTIYNKTLPGEWFHVESSVDSLSCNMLYEQNTQMVALLNFDRIRENFTVLGMLPLTTFTSDLTGMNRSVVIQTVQAAMSVGQNCQVMTYTNFNLTAGTFTHAAYRANADWTTVHIIVVPNNWQPQAVSRDLLYAISGNVLYAYNKNTFIYEAKYTFANAYVSYQLRSDQEKLLVWGINTVLAANNTGNLTLNSSGQIFVFNNFGSVLIKHIVLTSMVEFSGKVQSFFNVLHSPRLTKIGYGFTTDGNKMNSRSYGFFLDYNRNKAYPVQFSNPQRFFMTASQIDPQRDIDFNDFFMSLRNGTMANYTDPAALLAKPAYEQAYQFVGTNLTMIRSRDLGNDTNMVGNYSREFVSFLKTFIDPSTTTRCLIIDVYMASPTTYQLVEWDYGNIRSNNRVVIPPPPSYVSFVEPHPIDSMDSSMSIYQWAYFTRDVNNSVVLKVFSVNNATNNHYRVNDYPLGSTNTWTLVYQNPNCKILREFGGAGKITVNRQLPNGTYVSLSDLETVINVSALTNSSVWGMSSDCKRLRVDSDFYYIPQGQNWTKFTFPANFTLDQVDNNITYATSNGKLYKLPPDGNVVLVLDPPHPFPMGANVLTAGQRVALGKTNTTSAWFVGFESNINGQLQKCINYTNFNFVEQPLLEASPMLTKVIMVGKATPPAYLNSTTPRVIADFYLINCPHFQNISLPTTHLHTPSKLRVSLGEEVVHFKQLDNSTNKPIKDVVYYLDRNTVAVMAFEKNIAFPANTQFIRSQVWLTNSGNNFLASEYVWTDPNDTTIKKRIVNVTQVNGQQAIFNNKNNGSFVAQLVDGQIELCAPGCTDCDCNSCLTGYVLDTATATCLKCAPGCSACSATDQTSCTSCVEGAFLNSSTNACDPCDPQCDTCLGTATGCVGCPPGQFYSAGATACALCPRNCFQCTANTTCTICREGFVVTPTGLCRGCSIKCSECNPDNITQCTACSDGLFLNTNSQCEACPANCKQCGSATVCSVCEDKFTANANGVCVEQCQLPCIECADNLPSYCTVCPAYSTATNGACVPNFSCNTNQNCTGCGSGLNYILAVTSTGGSVCATCPNLENCVQCDPIDSYSCAICSNGFYSNSSGSCVACNSNCTSCWSDRICTGCTPGWTLKKGQTEGRCRACEYPCATCKGNTRYCTSCQSGFTRFGWKCRNNTGVEFQIVITATPAQIFAIIDNFACNLLEMLQGLNVTNATDCDQSNITFTGIAAGSVVASGSSSTGSSANLQVGLSSGGLSYPVASSSVTTYGTSTSESSSSSNIGLIVGLVVGLIALVVIIVVIVYCLKKRKEKAVSTVEEDNIMIEAAPQKQKDVESFEGINYPGSGQPIEEKF